MLVILSTYIIVHCTYNENVQSMCPPTTIHGKYPLCPIFIRPTSCVSAIILDATDDCVFFRLKRSLTD